MVHFDTTHPSGSISPISSAQDRAKPAREPEKPEEAQQPPPVPEPPDEAEADAEAAAVAPRRPRRRRAPSRSSRRGMPAPSLAAASRTACAPL